MTRDNVQSGAWKNIGWQDYAACTRPDIDPEIFFPAKKSGSQKDRFTKARNICGRCPVVSECLNAALEQNEVRGIWGGLSPIQRFDLGGPRPPGLTRGRRARRD
ncbi:WhiB family transcriptional regulator [Streptomyces sp. NPDC096153]|uniref:WhiB family transcriptional regulator n=1 Tax=Streptomyces sp. NPDC096153 TaxID=3155548 RepID=UPI00331D5721